MMDAQTNPTRRRAASFLATFGYAWLMIGLFTGTLVLVLFVGGIISATHKAGLGDTAENRVLIAVIIAFVIASFLLTRSVVRRLYRSQSITTRRVALGALIVPGALSMWAWSNPTRILARMAGSEHSAVAMKGGAEFIFGPYPDLDDLKKLKQEGVTTVISLQHPSVLVEIEGINDEKVNTKQLGLELVHAPMLPWVSDNQASLDKIREIARTAHGKFYVHCGLGRDRVNVVKRVIESMSGNKDVRLAQAANYQNAKGLEQRTEPFQRGRLFELKPGIWLVPIPNPMELSDILFGAEGRVLIVIDPRDSAQKAFSEQADKELSSYVIPHTVVPFTERDAADGERVALLSNRIQSERGRVTVIVPRTPFGNGTNERDTKVAQAILRSFNVDWSKPRPATDPRSSSQSAGTAGT